MGAKAGIGVGVAAAALILFAIGFVILRQRRKHTTVNQAQQSHRPDDERPYVDSKPELPAHENRKEISIGAAERAELPDRDRQELAAVQMPPELADDRRPELSAS